VIVQAKNRKPGRPRKKQDRIELWQFARAAVVISAYDEARVNGEKHSVAVTQAVDFVRRNDSEISISEAEARRILATYRPQSSETILRFEHSFRSEEDLRINRLIREELAALQGKEGIMLPEVPSYDLSERNLVLTIRVGLRPHYPRHNRKISNN